MTPPIRIRRRWEPGFDPRRAYPGYRHRGDLPWAWECRPCVWSVQIDLRSERTQKAALDAGLAHLAGCGYWADQVRRQQRNHASALAAGLAHLDTHTPEQP